MIERTKTFQRSNLRESSEQRKLLVEVISGPDAGVTIALEGRGIVGRYGSSELRLTDPTVSQFHVELTASPTGVRVRDLGSHNGVYVGTALIRDGLVPDGTELALGESMVRLSIGDAFEAELSKSTS